MSRQTLLTELIDEELAAASPRRSTRIAAVTVRRASSDSSISQPGRITRAKRLSHSHDDNTDVSSNASSVDEKFQSEVKTRNTPSKRTRSKGSTDDEGSTKATPARVTRRNSARSVSCSPTNEQQASAKLSTPRNPRTTRSMSASPIIKIGSAKAKMPIASTPNLDTVSETESTSKSDLFAQPQTDDEDKIESAENRDEDEEEIIDKNLPFKKKKAVLTKKQNLDTIMEKSLTDENEYNFTKSPTPMRELKVIINTITEIPKNAQSDSKTVEQKESQSDSQTKNIKDKQKNTTNNKSNDDLWPEEPMEVDGDGSPEVLNKMLLEVTKQAEKQQALEKNKEAVVKEHTLQPIVIIESNIDAIIKDRKSPSKKQNDLDKPVKHVNSTHETVDKDQNGSAKEILDLTQDMNGLRDEIVDNEKDSSETEVPTIDLTENMNESNKESLCEDLSEKQNETEETANVDLTQDDSGDTVKEKNLSEGPPKEHDGGGDLTQNVNESGSTKSPCKDLAEEQNKTDEPANVDLTQDDSRDADTEKNLSKGPTEEHDREGDGGDLTQNLNENKEESPSKEFAEEENKTDEPANVDLTQDDSGDAIKEENLSEGTPKECEQEIADDDLTQNVDESNEKCSSKDLVEEQNKTNEPANVDLTQDDSGDAVNEENLLKSSPKEANERDENNPCEDVSEEQNETDEPANVDLTQDDSEDIPKNPPKDHTPQEDDGDLTKGAVDLEKNPEQHVSTIDSKDSTQNFSENQIEKAEVPTKIDSTRNVAVSPKKQSKKLDTSAEDADDFPTLFVDKLPECDTLQGSIVKSCDSTAKSPSSNKKKETVKASSTPKQSKRVPKFVTAPDINEKIDQLVASRLDYDSSSDESAVRFLDDVAEEGEEDTPSEGSNNIVDQGESVGSTVSDIDTDESYELDSFIDDNEPVELLSGDEYDLGQSKVVKKKKRIVLINDSSDEQENNTMEEPDTDRTLIKNKSSNDEFNSENEEIIVNKGDDLKSLETIKQQRNSDTFEDKKDEVPIQKQSRPTANISTITEPTVTPNNSLSNSEIQKSRKLSLTIQENINVKDITSNNINECISNVLTAFYTNVSKEEKNLNGSVVLNISVDYLESPAPNLENDVNETKQSQPILNEINVEPSKTPVKKDAEPVESKPKKKQRKRKHKHEKKETDDRRAEQNEKDELKITNEGEIKKRRKKKHQKISSPEIVKNDEGERNDVNLEVKNLEIGKKRKRTENLKKDEVTSSQSKQDIPLLENKVDTAQKKTKIPKRYTKPVQISSDSKTSGSVIKRSFKAATVSNEIDTDKKRENKSLKLLNKVEYEENSKPKKLKLETKYSWDVTTANDIVIPSKSRKVGHEQQKLSNMMLPTHLLQQISTNTKQLVQDIIEPIPSTSGKQRPSRKRLLLPSITTGRTSWDSVPVNSPIKPSSTAKMSKSKKYKKGANYADMFQEKDFKNRMLYDSSRVRREDTKAFLKKKQKWN